MKTNIVVVLLLSSEQLYYSYNEIKENGSNSLIS